MFDGLMEWLQEILVVGEQTVFTLKDSVFQIDFFFKQRTHLAMAQNQATTTTSTLYHGFVLVLVGPFWKVQQFGSPTRTVVESAYRSALQSMA